MFFDLRISFKNSTLDAWKHYLTSSVLQSGVAEIYMGVCHKGVAGTHVRSMFAQKVTTVFTPLCSGY